MRPANERWRYNVTWSLIGWVHRQNYAWVYGYIVAINDILYQKNVFNSHYVGLPDMRRSAFIGPYVYHYVAWWRHQMETFSASLALCAGNSPGTDEFPIERPVTQSFGVFFGLPLNKRLNKQSGHRWVETPSRSLWRHWNVIFRYPDTSAFIIVSCETYRKNALKRQCYHFEKNFPTGCMGSGQLLVQAMIKISSKWQHLPFSDAYTDTQTNTNMHTPIEQTDVYIHVYAHTHIYVYKYIYIYICLMSTCSSSI